MPNTQKDLFIFSFSFVGNVRSAQRKIILADSASLHANVWSARELAYETTEWNASINLSFIFL